MRTSTAATARRTSLAAIGSTIGVALLAGLLLVSAPVPAGASGVGDRAAAKATKHHPGKAGRSSRSGAVRGTLTSLPPIVQPGTTPVAPDDDGSLVATFTPADPGQEVVLEQRARRGWKVVATSVEDLWGSAAFSPRPGTYRARTTTGARTWVTGTVTSTRWQPQFEDTFSGTTLDTTVWNDQRREHESVYAPRTCARVDAAARQVGGGVLRLGVAPDPALAAQPCAYTTTRGSGTSPYLLNSQVATEQTRFFRHGIVAARIKPQRAKGMHTGFWMLPAGTTYTDGTPAAGTEIDVMEFFGETGRGNDTIGSHVHYYEAGWNKVSLGDTYPTARRVLGEHRDWWDEFHVFSVEWTPQAYVFRVDGREYYRETRAVSQAEQYLVLSNLTSDYELAELTPDELDDTAQVDWVRVFGATSRFSSRTTPGRRVAR